MLVVYHLHEETSSSKVLQMVSQAKMNDGKLGLKCLFTILLRKPYLSKETILERVEPDRNSKMAARNCKREAYFPLKTFQDFLFILKLSGR